MCRGCRPTERRIEAPDDGKVRLQVQADRLADEVLDIPQAASRVTGINDLPVQGDKVVAAADRHLPRRMQAGREPPGLSGRGRLMLDPEACPGFPGEEMFDRPCPPAGRAALQNLPAPLVETPGDGGRDCVGAANGGATARAPP